jgi:hypothetical protein
MQDANSALRCLTRLCQLTDAELLISLWPVVLQLARLAKDFRSRPVSPQTTYDFENQLQRLLCEMGRKIVQWRLNSLESGDPHDLPPVLFYEGDAYRRKRLSPTRNLNCLFGKIRLQRWLYEPIDGLGLSALFPLELQLGIVAGVATPALADRVARLAADLPQRQLLSVLVKEHQVRWGVETLRKVVAAMAEGLSPFRHQAHVTQVLAWLQQAADKSGPRKILLSVGRDGIMLPIRGSTKYKEGATATVSVYNRWGKRLGTVYLGQMPEELQTSLSNDLTRLLEDVLRQWDGPPLRLAYITDAGFHPTDYFQNVLCSMPDPWRPGKYLPWEWVVDYYHACQYISQLGQTIFGPGRESYAWAAKMRRLLKEKPGGIFRVLRSAGQLRSIRGLVGEESEYQSAYNYLWRHSDWMNYSERCRLRAPIGSGVTEAACKIVFTQRFKCAGMKWTLEREQPILALRVIALSGIWSHARELMFKSHTTALPQTPKEFRNQLYQIPL